MKIAYYIIKVLRKIINRPAVVNTNLHKEARVDIGSLVVESSLGRYSYIGEHTSLLYTEVGAFTSISNYCAIGGGGHPTNWVSMSPVFNTSKGLIKKKIGHNPYEPYEKVQIGNDVWIGSHCLIKAGVKIADGAVVGMGSVVTKDIGPYEIWAGNPARLIRHRFPEEDREFLLSTQWWTWDEESIRDHANTFHDIDAFKSKLTKQEKRMPPVKST